MSTEIALTTGRLTADQVVRAWEHAKTGKSKETERAYMRVLFTFRMALQSVNLDIDCTDPRRVAEMVALSPRYVTASALEQRQAVDDTVEAIMTQIAAVTQAWAAMHDPAPATINRRLAIASSLYRYALKQGYLHGANPIERAERADVQAYASARPLAPEAITDGMRKIDRTTLQGMRDYALLSLALHTGKRASELAAMTWKYVDIQAATIVITFPRAKGGKVLVSEIPRTKKAAQDFLSWIDASDRITGPDSPIWYSLDSNGTYGHQLTSRTISRICQRRLGISKVHSLRHTFAHSMEQSGAPVSVIADLLGHSDIATTGRYLKSLSQGKNDYLDKLSALYDF